VVGNTGPQRNGRYAQSLLQEIGSGIRGRYHAWGNCISIRVYASKGKVKVLDFMNLKQLDVSSCSGLVLGRLYF
jgi:hypothetical protein